VDGSCMPCSLQRAGSADAKCSATCSTRANSRRAAGTSPRAVPACAPEEACVCTKRARCVRTGACTAGACAARALGAARRTRVRCAAVCAQPCSARCVCADTRVRRTATGGCENTAKGVSIERCISNVLGLSQRNDSRVAACMAKGLRAARGGAHRPCAGWPPAEGARPLAPHVLTNGGA